MLWNDTVSSNCKKMPYVLELKQHGRGFQAQSSKDVLGVFKKTEKSIKPRKPEKKNRTVKKID